MLIYCNTVLENNWFFETIEFGFEIWNFDIVLAFVQMRCLMSKLKIFRTIFYKFHAQNREFLINKIRKQIFLFGFPIFVFHLIVIIDFNYSVPNNFNHYTIMIHVCMLVQFVLFSAHFHSIFVQFVYLLLVSQKNYSTQTVQ